MAAKNAFLTHVLNYGQVVPLKDVLSELLENSEIRMHVIYDRIIELAHAVGTVLTGTATWPLANCHWTSVWTPISPMAD